MEKARYVLGIDPSLNGCGYAILDIKNKKPKIAEKGSLPMKTTMTTQQKLSIIGSTIRSLVAKYQPLHYDVFLERGFTKFNKSTQATYKARGCIEAELVSHNIIEFTPSQVKATLTAHGDASKDSVADSVMEMFGLPSDYFITDDESDAVAVAVTGYLKMNRK